jgi:hypothetical protein
MQLAEMKKTLQRELRASGVHWIDANQLQAGLSLPFQDLCNQLAALMMLQQ